MRRLFELRKNNKGDTLVIVIVGVLLLGILGAVVLASTTMNYSMKNIDKSQKKNFYNAEEALDQVYAGVGKDVMESMEFAYTYVLNHIMTRNAEGHMVTRDNAELNKAFRSIFYYNLTGQEPTGDAKPDNWDAILYGTVGETGLLSSANPVYKNGVAEQQTLLTHLQSFITSGAATAPTVKIPLSTAANPITAVNYASRDAVTSSGATITLNYFTLKDVVVTSTSTDEVSSRVSTDIVVEVPLVDINFSEVTTLDYGELFKYIILAEGKALSPGTPSMTVNSMTQVKGNIFAGKLASEGKRGIYLNQVTMNMKSENVVTSGNIEVYNGELSMTGEEEGASSKLWARNVATKGKEDVIDLAGVDCIVKDDLEIDGEKSVVKITGNYFGIGFRADATNPEKEANSSENDWMYFDDASGNAYDYNSNYTGNIATDGYEHRKSSSIVVNGRDASLDLRELSYLVLGGRAYVDLVDPDAGLGESNSTYMTGESLSIRGNQEAYLADIRDREYFRFGDGTPFADNVVTSNPVTYDFYLARIAGAGVLQPKTVAKRVGNNVYFYQKSTSPLEQTKTFEDYFKSTAANKASLREKADGLGVQQILLGDTTNILSVGTLMSVDNTKPDTQRVLVLDHTVENGNSPVFTRYMKDLKLRYKAMATELKDYGNITSTTVPSNVASSIEASTKTPIATYIDTNKFLEVFLGTVPGEDTSKLSDGNGDGVMDTYTAEHSLLTDSVFTADEMVKYNITNPNSTVVLTNVADYRIAGTVSNGIIVAANDVTVAGDFTGLIICAGDIKIDSGDPNVEVKLQACPALTRWIAGKDVTLNACLKGYLAASTTGDGEATGHVTISDVKYQDLVSYQNWQKKAVNEEQLGE